MIECHTYITSGKVILFVFVSVHSGATETLSTSLLVELSLFPVIIIIVGCSNGGLQGADEDVICLIVVSKF